MIDDCQDPAPVVRVRVGYCHEVEGLILILVDKYIQVFRDVLISNGPVFGIDEDIMTPRFLDEHAVLLPHVEEVDEDGVIPRFLGK